MVNCKKVEPNKALKTLILNANNLFYKYHELIKFLSAILVQKFFKTYNLNRYLKQMHKIEDTIKSMKIKCIICKDDVPSMAYHDHLEKTHDIKLNIKLLNFENEKGKIKCSNKQC